MRLMAWQQTGIIRRTKPSDFSGAFLHALHSMAMIDVFTGDIKKPTRGADMRPFGDIFWDGLKPDPARSKRRRSRSVAAKRSR